MGQLIKTFANIILYEIIHFQFMFKFITLVNISVINSSHKLILLNLTFKPIISSSTKNKFKWFILCFCFKSTAVLIFFLALRMPLLQLHKVSVATVIVSNGS
jgi:hypothetical protein